MSYIRRPHQIEAIDDVLAGFETHDRGQLIMACGSGKTLTTRWIAEDLGADLSLVLVPSISLLDQFAAEWAANASAPFTALCVCSDETVGLDRDADMSTEELRRQGLTVTSCSTVIRDFLVSGHGKRVVYSTYQSTHLVAAAQADDDSPHFDIAIADEAHRTAGESSSQFSIVLDERRIKARKRLFATATPKVFRGRKSGKGELLFDMSNEAIYGPRFHTLSFSRAIALGLLCDYRVVVALTEDEELRSIGNDERTRVPESHTVDAVAISLLKALQHFGLKKVISFHRSLKAASEFRNLLTSIAPTLSREGKGPTTFRADFLAGGTSMARKKAVLASFRSSDAAAHVLTNARCLTEGVDVPAVDGVSFTDPKSSEIDIVQAIGRALRLSPGKTVGTIMLPVFLAKGDSPHEVVEKTDFRSVWSVLNALRAHDEDFAAKIVEASRSAGRRQGVSDIFSKVNFLGGANVVGIADVLKPIVIADMVDPWIVGLHYATERFKAVGDCNAQGAEVWPPGTSDGFPLGKWIRTQRHDHNRGRINPIRKVALENLGIVWKVENAMERGISCLAAWKERFGDANPPANAVWSVDGGSDFRLGAWVSNLRVRYAKGLLPPTYVERLRALGVTLTSIQDEWWAAGFRAATSWASKYGTCNAPQSSTWPEDATEGYPLGNWIVKQRILHSKSLLSESRCRQLEELRIVWKLGQQKGEKSWNAGYEAAKLYAEVFGDCNAPQSTCWPAPDGFRLGKWISEQRQSHRRGSLSEDRVRRLEGLGINWSPPVGRRAANGPQGSTSVGNGYASISPMSMELGLQRTCFLDFSLTLATKRHRMALRRKPAVEKSK
ncbi:MULTISPECIES: DEAD/DEAH box helicase [Cupriavidus]|nr:DEAD/DEAH box helicase [Cupriavidus taiwanensis]NOV26630.1 hypothetical protein [Cupriavidus necator]NSX13247.1 Helicase associated domain protein [Cupriavidus taiwanensis]SOZ18886.1 hypothetical protein CBM2597_U30058 [Cupriavidus taiwanensis]